MRRERDSTRIDSAECSIKERSTAVEVRCTFGEVKLVLFFWHLKQYLFNTFGNEFPFELFSLIIKVSNNIIQPTFALGSWKNRYSYKYYRPCLEEELKENWLEFVSL